MLVAALPAWIGALAVFVGLEAPLFLLALSTLVLFTLSHTASVGMKRYWLALLLVSVPQALAVERVVSLAPSLSEIVLELSAE